MVAILMTSLLGPDAEIRWANWLKLLQIPHSLILYRSPKIVTKFTRDHCSANSTYTKRFPNVPCCVHILFYKLIFINYLTQLIRILDLSHMQYESVQTHRHSPRSDCTSTEDYFVCKCRSCLRNITTLKL